MTEGPTMDMNAPESMTPWLRHAGGHRSAVSRDEEELTVGEVASLVGISVRTLHHWDATGLVRPRVRTSAGYRSYSGADVERVHRVLVYRELGFGLSAIATLLDDPGVDEEEQLRRQRHMLEERIGRLTSMVRAVDEILAARSAGTTLTARRQAEIFGRGWREDWADEARARWGGSGEWAQFERSAGRLSADERRRLNADGEALYTELAAAVRDDVAPESRDGIRLAERHRAMIGRLFDCTHAMHVCLGRLLVDDERFTAGLERRQPGLAVWLRRAVDENARRNGVDPGTAAWS